MNEDKTASQLVMDLEISLRNSQIENKWLLAEIQRYKNLHQRLGLEESLVMKVETS